MQLDNAAILPYLLEDIDGAWSLVGTYPDAQRVQNETSQLPKVRIELQAGTSEPQGSGAASRHALLPHVYRITGTFAYPDSGTVLEAQAERWNQLAALLTAEYPYYHGLWRYQEAIGWEFDDNPTERVYKATVIFTLDVISPVKMITIPGP